MGTSRRALALAVPVVAMSLIITACGSDKKGGGGNNNASQPKSDTTTSAGPSGSSKPATSSGPTKAPPVSNTKVVDINATPYAQVKDGGTWNTSIDQFSTQWNYFQTNGAEASTTSVEGPLMPESFKVTATGTFVPDANYLLSATESMVGGKQVVKYELNPKAKWSDGTPVTWKDYAALATALSGKDQKYEAGTTTGYEQIASVKQGKNQFEAVVTFSVPFGEWKGLFSILYPAKIIGTSAGFNKGYLGKIPLTAGPFKLSKMDQTTKVVTVVRDPKWWGQKPKLDTINYRVLTAQAAPGAFTNGEINDLGIGPDPNAYKQAKGVKGATIHTTTGPNFRLMVFNGKSPILSDEKVRQAVAEGLDRDVIAKSDLKGLDFPAGALNNHFYIPGQKGFEDTAGEYGVYSKTNAGKLLDDAGWKMSGDVRKKGGKSLELSLVIPAGTPVAENEATLVTAMLGQIGVKVKTVNAPSDDFFDKYVSVGKYDLSVYSWLGGAAPISGNAPLFVTPGAHGSQNYSQFGVPKIDAALRKALQEVDLAKAITDANAADKLVFQSMMMLTLYQRPAINATRDGLVNYGSTAFQTINWTLVGFKK